RRRWRRVQRRRDRCRAFCGQERNPSPRDSEWEWAAQETNLRVPIITPAGGGKQQSESSRAVLGALIPLSDEPSLAGNHLGMKWVLAMDKYGTEKACVTSTLLRLALAPSVSGWCARR